MYHVGVGAVHGGAHIDRVGVVPALFAHRIEVMHQLGIQRIVVLELELQAEGDVPRKRTRACDLVYLARWRRRTNEQSPRLFQVVAEIFPGAERLVVIGHGGVSCRGSGERRTV